MKIGFIGAGKAGFSLGKFLTERGIEITGYYNHHPESAAEAAQFTGTRAYDSKDQLVADSDMLFLTVPDRAILPVWEEIKSLGIQNKIICHISGAHSSELFSGIKELGAFGYSIHPLFAFHDRYTSYKGLSGTFFTIEGDPARLDQIKQLLECMGNRYAVIKTDSKTKYHAAAAIVSNLYVGLSAFGLGLLQECGFSAGEAQEALAPLIRNNAENIASAGPVNALTGPIERNDTETVLAHLSCMSKEQAEVYRVLSKEVVKVAKAKNPDRDYSTMEEILK
ncbi:MAG: DUF2520 domain-containing protein [Lachnospiraceae bacterium]|nr:DUF2520 domain-containing protein [Lachnospiraceae bacterium]